MKILFSALFALASVSAFCGERIVTYDENGNINPANVRTVLSNACSAVVSVNIAEAKAEILTNVAGITSQTLVRANELLTARTDYVLIDLYASGVEDATSDQMSTGQDAQIVIVESPTIDRTTDPDNVLITFTWQYQNGSLSSPVILASSGLGSNDVFVVASMTTPEQIAWGNTVAYRATASVSKATYGDTAFFKIQAQINAPLDDGQVFDTYSDGTDYWLDLVPTNHYRMRIISGRITTVQLVQ